jgi:hypothetical protein
MIVSLELVCVTNDDQRQPKREANQYHPDKRAAGASPPAQNGRGCGLMLN